MNIHQTGVLSRKGVVSLGACLAVSSMLLLPGRSVAQIVNMTDGGSTASVDLLSGAGMYNWSVLGQNQLMQQWFWYRTDGGNAQPINTIGLAGYQQNANNTLDVFYQNSQLSIKIVYALTGTGSGSADMLENIYAVNLTGSPINLNLYEYSYFDLLQSGNNSVQIFKDSTTGKYNFVQQTSGSTAIQEGIVSPYADYAEAAAYNQTLNELNTQSGLILNDTISAGPGAVTWAFQWDKTIAANGGVDIFKDKTLSIQMVPEPPTVAIIALGAGALGLALRRKLS